MSQDVLFHCSPQVLAQAIDHTQLTFQPEDEQDALIIKRCEEAKACGFYAVCVRPQHVTLANAQLQGSAVKVATVIGFPLDKRPLADELAHPTMGSVPLDVKRQEIIQAKKDGADELDVVMDVARFKASVDDVLMALVALQRDADGLPLKVIIETDLLTVEEIQQATKLCIIAQVAMVKTSTGMLVGGKGATMEAIAAIKTALQVTANDIAIKASGGIRSAEQAMTFLQAGVSRLGTSAGCQIIQALKESCRD